MDSSIVECGEELILEEVWVNVAQIEETPCKEVGSSDSTKITFYQGKQKTRGPQRNKYIISENEDLQIDDETKKKIWVKGPTMKPIEIVFSNKVPASEVMKVVYEANGKPKPNTFCYTL